MFMRNECSDTFRLQPTQKGMSLDRIGASFDGDQSDPCSPVHSKPPRLARGALFGLPSMRHQQVRPPPAPDAADSRTPPLSGGPSVRTQTNRLAPAIASTAPTAKKTAGCVILLHDRSPARRRPAVSATGMAPTRTTSANRVAAGKEFRGSSSRTPTNTIIHATAAEAAAVCRSAFILVLILLSICQL